MGPLQCEPSHCIIVVRHGFTISASECPLCDDFALRFHLMGAALLQAHPMGCFGGAVGTIGVFAARANWLAAGGFIIGFGTAVPK